MAKKKLKPQTLLIPLPAVMVSCKWGNNKPNIITASWVGIACSEPPMISLAIRKSRHSHSIIQKSGEFVVNLTTEKLLEETDFCGSYSGKNMDKFEKTGLTPEVGSVVSAPLIKECPINLECQVKHIIELGSHDLFIADIVASHADEEYLDAKDRPDLNKFKPLIYCTKAQEYWGGLSKKLEVFGFSRKEKS
ncbi:MAG: flavin reductase family protein [candidate division Zixibacteria bacterium]|nr:flavin reductase family protein [candidate division Zixibacteria bacterium]